MRAARAWGNRGSSGVPAPGGSGTAWRSPAAPPGRGGGSDSGFFQSDLALSPQNFLLRSPRLPPKTPPPPELMGLKVQKKCPVRKLGAPRCCGVPGAPPLPLHAGPAAGCRSGASACVWGPDLLVSELLGPGLSGHAEGLAVFLPPSVSGSACLWVLILGLPSHPLEGFRLGRAGSGWVGRSGLGWSKSLKAPHLHCHLLQGIGGPWGLGNRRGNYQLRLNLEAVGGWGIQS